MLYEVITFDEASYGAAMLYFTGSKDHNIALRKIAILKKYKLSEYGLFSGGKSVAGKTEEEVYKKLGLKQWIPPELRENPVGGDAHGEDGGLGVLGHPEVLLRTAEAEVGQGEPERSGSLIEDFPCDRVGLVEFLPHTRKLGRLSGKEQPDLHLFPLHSQQGGSPGQSRSEGRKEHKVPLPEPSLFPGFREGDRDGGGGGVPVPLEIYEHFLLA